MPGRRVHHQAGGLVDDEHRVVLVRDAQRDRLRDQRLVRRGGQLDRDPLPADEAIAGPTPGAIDNGTPVADQPLRVGAADAGDRRHGDVDAARRRLALHRSIRHGHAAGPSRRRVPSAKVRYSTSTPLPTTTAESATLKGGKRVVPIPTLMKSITYPRRNRSVRLPSVPARITP